MRPNLGEISFGLQFYSLKFWTFKVSAYSEAKQELTPTPKTWQELYFKMFDFTRLLGTSPKYLPRVKCTKRELA